MDTRSNIDFAKVFIPQSINIGLDGDFAPWVGALLVDVKQAILLVTDRGEAQEAITRLSRVGFDHILGYLEGGMEAWELAGKETDKINRISAEQFAKECKTSETMIIDVRKESEYNAEHVEDAYSRPLAYINDWINDIHPQAHFYLHCAGGYRSMMAASILQARGYRNFSEIEGGFTAIAETDIPKTDFVCQSKLVN